MIPSIVAAEAPAVENGMGALVVQVPP
jgi:hypothetical protein